MTPTWSEALAECPLIAILRGLRPEEAVEIAGVLVDAGFRIIEVPLNSPDPCRSISAIAAEHGNSIVLGAGTVLNPAQIDEVEKADGRLIIAPNMSERVGRYCAARDLLWAPGVLSPTEAFFALELGAAMLKIFPAEIAGPAGIKAMKAVLPSDIPVAAVGGVNPDTISAYHAAGATAYGLGSGLYKPGMKPAQVGENARRYIEAFKSL